MRALWYREWSFLGNWLALLAAFAMVPIQLLFDSMNASSHTWITDSFTGAPMLPLFIVFMLFHTTVVDKEQGVPALYLLSGGSFPSYALGKTGAYMVLGAAQWAVFTLCHLNRDPANDALLWTWATPTSLLLTLTQILITGQIIVYATITWRDVRASMVVGVFLLVWFPSIILQAMLLPCRATLLLVVALLAGDLIAMRLIGPRVWHRTVGAPTR